MSMTSDFKNFRFLQQLAQGNQGQAEPMQPIVSPYDMMAQPGEAPEVLPQQEGSNPIMMGASNAREMAKRSLQLSNSENQRALGQAMLRGLTAMRRNPPAVGTGFAGTLGMINEGFEPAVAQYNAERDRIAQMNYMLEQQMKAEKLERMKEERAARQEERLQKQLEHQMRIQESELGLKSKKLQHEMGERNAADAELIAQGVTPFSTMKTGPERLYARRRIHEGINRATVSQHAVNDIDKIIDILGDHPDITQRWGTILLAAQRNDPSIVKQKLSNWFIPKEERVAATMMSKLMANLFNDKLKGLPSNVRGNMFVEKIMREGSVSDVMDKDAIIELLDRDKEILSPLIQDGERYSYYEQMGGEYHPVFESAKPKEKAQEEVVAQTEQGSVAQPALKNNKIDLLKPYTLEQLKQVARQKSLEQQGSQ